MPAVRTVIGGRRVIPREFQPINQSVTALRTVLQALAMSPEQAPFIRYRESSLTMLLKEYTEVADSMALRVFFSTA